MLSVAAVVVVVLAGLASLASFFMGGRLSRLGSPRFELEDIPDLSGKIAIVTGANSGIGKITARELAMHGAHVIATCRDPASGARAQQEIMDALNRDQKYKHGSIEFLHMDLARLISVYKFAREISFKNKPIDILVLNAGIMLAPFNLTEDGYESQFGVNYLGHFVLTRLLLPWLTRSNAARIVHVSSLAHHSTYNGGINFRSMYDASSYNPM
jgi:NAD(P)-dependent dehydrogenase (short-subunit alcohol dehydrogenase family)